MTPRLRALKQDPDLRRFARFVVVGVVNTLFGYSVFTVLILVGAAPQVALTISFVIGVMWNYFTHGRFVFQNRGWKRFRYYVGAYVAIYLGNSAALHALLATGLHPILAQGLILPFSAVAAFLLVGMALTGQLPISRR